MVTYYEILRVSTTATVAEIETAYEDRYNYWRRLVTHHDPEMVNKANQALRWLEKVHATLTDPARRMAYDAGIGLRGPVGGLADPQAKPRVPTPTPSPPRVESPASASALRVDAWVCPECQTANPIGMRFCTSCGHTLGRDCPNCGELVETEGRFCLACGVDVEALLQEQKRQKEKDEARLAQEIQGVLGQVEYELKQKRYGKALDLLQSFGGMGRKTESSGPNYGKDQPEWHKARALRDSAQAVKREQTRHMAGVASMAYACVSGVVGSVAAIIYGIDMNSWSEFGTALLYAAGATVASAIIAAIGAAVYCDRWGGWRTTGQEYTLVMLSPIGLVLAAGLAVLAGSAAVVLIGVVIVVVVVIIILMIVLGGG